MITRTRRHVAGFTLTEMAIVLGVVGVLVAGLWNLLSGANQQARDTSAANQQTQLIAAAKQFLASADGQNYMNTNGAGACGGPCGVGANFILPLPTNPAGSAACAAAAPADANLAANGMAGAALTPGAFQRAAWCQFLPPGITNATINSYGQTFGIRILRDGTAAGQAPNTYSFMIMTTGPAIPDTSGGRISSSVGGDGGFVYTNAVCTPTPGPPGPATTACGSYGSWSSPVATYGFAGISGTIASRTFMSSQQSSLQDWLARRAMPGDPTYTLNSMMVPEYLGNHALVMGTYTPTATPDFTNTIYMGNFSSAPAAPQPTTGGGYLNMQAGSINFNYLANPGGPLPLTGTMNVQGGVINFNSPAAPAGGGGTMNVQGGTINFGTAAFPGTLSGEANIDTINNLTLNVPFRPAGVAMQILGTTSPSAGVSPASLEAITGDCTGVFYPPPGPPVGSPPSKVGCSYAFQVTGDINVNGVLNSFNLYAGTFIYQGSDIRFKKDIHPIEDPLADVMELKPVWYTLRSTGEKSLGVVAQDLEKVYPQLVSTYKGMKYVDYQGLIAPLIGAVQELKAENEALGRQIEEQSQYQKKLEQELRSHYPEKN